MEKTFDFNTIGKRMPYTVPEDFFAKLEEDVMQDVRKEDTPAKSQNKALRIVMSSVLAVAAAVALFLVLHPMINKNDMISADNYASVEMAEKQARHIARELALDDATTTKYVNTYKACQQEIWALGPRIRRHQGNASEAEAEQANKARFEQSEKILRIREKYYKEYSKFLTQKQIDRAYELERQVMRRLAKHHRQGAGGMKHRTHQGRR